MKEYLINFILVKTSNYGIKRWIRMFYVGMVLKKVHILIKYIAANLLWLIIV